MYAVHTHTHMPIIIHIYMFWGDTLASWSKCLTPSGSGSSVRGLSTDKRNARTHAIVKVLTYTLLATCEWEWLAERGSLINVVSTISIMHAERTHDAASRPGWALCELFVIKFAHAWLNNCVRCIARAYRVVAGCRSTKSPRLCCRAEC